MDNGLPVADQAVGTAGSPDEARRVVIAWRCPSRRQASAITPLQHQTGYGEAIRTINADAVPIVVLRPFGPVEFVYEAKDTAGRPLPGEHADPFLAFGRVPPTRWERTLAAARKCGVVVEDVENYGGGLAGTATMVHGSQHGGEATAMTEQGNVGWRVRINKKLPEAARFLTLAHELAHIYCGHLGEDPRGRWPNRQKLLGESQRELEAEAAAWLVCRRAGLDTRSADYLAEKVDLDDLTAISVFAVLAAAHRIEARGEKDGNVSKLILIRPNG